MPAAPSMRFALLSAVVAWTAIAATTAPVEAQSFFESFRRPHIVVSPNSYAPHHRSGFFEDLFGLFRGEEVERVEDGSGSGVYANYCVRTCDGKYFPVNHGQRGDGSLDKVCKAMCPAAETEIFRGAGIEHATAGDGKKYTALPHAFAYRSRIVDNCTCNGRDPFGVVNADLKDDPTLRAGDIVVRPEQIVVFQGKSSSRRTGDYSPIKDARNVSATARKQLSIIRVLENNPHATFAKTKPVLSPSDAVAQNHSLEARSPNENAPAAEPPARAN